MLISDVTLFNPENLIKFLRGGFKRMVRIVKATETIYKNLDEFLTHSGLTISDLKHMMQNDETGNGNVVTIRDDHFFISDLKLNNKDTARMEGIGDYYTITRRKSAEKKIKNILEKDNTSRGWNSKKSKDNKPPLY